MPDMHQLLKRQEILGDFGEFAIRSQDLDEVLMEACRLVAEALGTDRSKVLEIQPGREELLVRAGVGWAPNVVGSVRLRMTNRSSETYSIEVAQPVVVPDIAAETRFDIPAFMRDAGITSMVNVPIFVPGQRPYGVLQVDAATPREFGDDEIQFLRTYAMILGPVIDRLRLVKDRARAEEAFRESEARLTAAFESVPVGIAVIDTEGRIVLANSQYREFMPGGLMPSRYPERASRWQAWDDDGHLVPTVGYPSALALQGSTVVPGLDMLFTTDSGEMVWTNVATAPTFDEAGIVTGFVSVISDIDTLKRNADALRKSEERQRALIEGVPQLVWQADVTGYCTWTSPQWTSYTGQSLEDSRGWGWLDLVHPDDREAVRATWLQALDQGSFEADYRIHGHGTGTYRWFQNRATPISDGSGQIVEWLGTSTDVDELRRLQERQNVLVAELQHRTRNLMGVVRSTADKTARASADLADFRNRFGERLEALSRVQGLLSRLNDHDRVTFDELIETELAAMGNGSDRVRLVGPKGVRLRSSMVQTLAMALHELATNAIKYGALGQEDAGLVVTWSLADDEGTNETRLDIDWRETGVTMPASGAKPSGGGQGRELIEKALPYQLSAKTSYALEADGVHCTISIPVSTTPSAGGQHA